MRHINLIRRVAAKGIFGYTFNNEENIDQIYFQPLKLGKLGHKGRHITSL